MQVKILASSAPGHVFPEVDFNVVQWKFWGTPRSTAAVNAYFQGPGEYDQETLLAFNLGYCGSTFSYRALEWLAKGQNLDPSNYFNTCTGQGVGKGWGP